MKTKQQIEKEFDEEFPHNLYESKNPETKGLAFNPFIKEYIHKTRQQDIDSVINFLQKIEDEKWNDAEHCSCLGFAISQLKDN